MRSGRSGGASGLSITARLVRNVSVVMLLVLLSTSGFVFWRVQHALDRQLDRDLDSYRDVVVQAVRSGTDVPGGTRGQWYQVFAPSGELVVGSARTPEPLLAGQERVRLVLAGAAAGERFDVGRMLPPDPRTYRARATRATSPDGDVVVVTAISRQPRDEALRELLGQLAIADVLVLVAAALVGYRTARGALDPVERYRRAAETAGVLSGVRLPVSPGRDDEVVRLGRTLNDLLERIDASARRERQFVADASHELRTPLALMKAELELALHRPRSSEQSRAVLTSVAGDVDRMIDLANALLDLEELAGGPLMTERVDVHALLSTVASRFEAVLAAEGRTVTVEPGGHVVLDLSRRWVEAAVVNLVANAANHGEGGVRLRARVAGSSIVLAVVDHGPGFDDDFRPVAFDRFTRSDASRSTAGSGLGLALVRAVAQMHGGTVGLSSDEGGTVVELVLPIDGAS